MKKLNLDDPNLNDYTIKNNFIDSENHYRLMIFDKYTTKLKMIAEIIKEEDGKLSPQSYIMCKKNGIVDDRIVSVNGIVRLVKKFVNEEYKEDMLTLISNSIRDKTVRENENFINL